MLHFLAALVTTSSISKDLREKGLIGKVKGRPGKEEDCREEAT